MTEVNDELECQYRKASKKKSVNFEELNELSHEELIHKVIQLEAQNTQLKNILQKKFEEENNVVEVNREKKKTFQSCAKRHVLLKFYYLGWDCHGYVTQDDTTNTIEHHVFHALEKCCLIDRRETSNYQRCGRTDKGVSAFCQVISIDLRSKLHQPNANNCNDELPYPIMINRLLPEFIRCYAWAHIDSDVSARFDCTSRTYHYYFPKGDLNIMLMKEGVKQLIGSHDFRNLCKMDVGNGVTKFIRNITEADIKPCSDLKENDYAMYKFIITGNGFLWHQIRCIMTVLILIGKGKESPDIIKELLDVKKNPSKPQYKMSSHIPLTLFDSAYVNTDIKWNVDENNLINTIQSLQRHWSFYSIKEEMIKEMIETLSKIKDEELHVKLQTESLLIEKESKDYKPLLSRMKCASLEDRIDHYVKRRKLTKINTDDKT